jgi:hypothetical protein
MRGRSARLALAIGAAALASTASAAPAEAEAPWLKQVKDLGLPARNCQYCHTAALPKKETFSPEELNARGRWLLEQKGERGGNTVSLDLLKRYPGGLEQK